MGTHCIDCGRATAGGLRCKSCHGLYVARQALVETAEVDRTILAMVDEEHLTGQRIAARLGISRVRARQKIVRAREREAMRVELRAAE
jgi:DNA-directed RNA polymerase specialized sigma24 family protein